MKKILLLLSLFVFGAMQVNAQETKKEKEQLSSLMIEIKEGKTPELYIDGVKYDIAILDVLDPDKIESIDIFKNEKIDNDVIKIVTTKNKKVTKNVDSENFRADVNAQKGDIEPMIIIDGKVVKKGKLDKLNPENIESIRVIKGDDAVENYNAPNGVILVITKKK